MHKGYYALLGVSPTASASEIRPSTGAKGWSKCESNGGNHYQLKAASIKWFLNIANGADPGP
jgi:hypothetical protein